MDFLWFAIFDFLDRFFSVIFVIYYHVSCIHFCPKWCTKSQIKTLRDLAANIGWETLFRYFLVLWETDSVLGLIYHPDIISIAWEFELSLGLIRLSGVISTTWAFNINLRMVYSSRRISNAWVFQQSLGLT